MRLASDILHRWMASDRPLRQIPRTLAMALVLGLTAMLALAAITATPARDAPPSAATASASGQSAPGRGDLALYERIVGRVAAGEDYYAVAADEHRSRNYPTRPFVTIRPPTLAWLTAGLGMEGVRWLAIGLLVATILVWERKLAALGEPLIARAAFAILLYLGAIGVFTERNLLLHELPAGLLLTLAFGLYHRRWWGLALVAALAAVALREIAAHFLLAWLGFALLERRWKEVIALIAALATVAAGLFLHHAAVTDVLLPGDPASPGWAQALGPAFVLESLARFSFLLLVPAIIAAPLALLALLGWIGLPGRAGLFAAVWFSGFFAAIAVFARADNFYWVLLTMPAFLAGLVLAPRAMTDLIHAMKGPRERQI